MPGEHVLYFTPSYTITASDLERSTLQILFTAEADGGRVRMERTFRFDLRTGAVAAD